MANKTIVGINAGRIGTIGSGDDGVINSISITNNANIGGNLTVEGDIISSGTQNAVVKDDFMDLNIGYTSTAMKSGGFTINQAAVSGHTANVTASFTAAVTGDTAPVNTVTVSGVPTNGETYVLQNLNQEFTLSFTNSGGTDATFTKTNSQTFAAAIDITSDDDANKIADAIATLFNGLTDYTCTASTNTAPITGANFSQQLKITQKTDGTGGDLSTGETTVGNGQAAFVTTSSGTAFAAGDILVVAEAGDTENDGVFVVSSVAANGGGQNVFIKGTSSITVDPSIPFAQTNFTTNGSDTTGRLIQSRLFVLGASNGADFPDSGGTAIVVGKPIFCFSTGGLETEFTTNGNYEEIGVGNTTLQSAYDNSSGAGITTSAAGGALDIDGDQQVTLVTTSTAANALQIVNNGASNANVGVLIQNSNSTSDQAIDITANGTGGGVRVRGGAGTGESVNLHARSTDGISNAGTTTQTSALQLRSESGGASLVAAKEIAISQVSDLSAVATLTVGAFTPEGANAASVNTVNVRGDRVTNTIPLIANESFAAGNQAIAVQAGASLGLITYGGGTNQLPANASTQTIDNATITAVAGGVITITFNSATAPGASGRVGQAVTIGTNGLTDNLAGITSILGSLVTVLNAITGITVTSDAASGSLFIKEDQNAAADNFTINAAASGTTNATAVTQNFGYAAAVLADADLAGLGTTIGFAGIKFLGTAAAIGDTVDTVISGLHSVSCVDAGAAIGQTLYIDEGTAGSVTVTAPSASNQIVFQVGTCMSAVDSGTCLVLLQPQFVAELA